MSDINIPINPKEVRRESDGTYYICGRCGARFKDAPRCPECGQLVATDEPEDDDLIYTIDEIEKLYDSYGITYDSVKGPYRIMGGRNSKSSSLNLNKHSYVIYSSDVDFENIVAANYAFDDLELVKAGNAGDGNRPNTVKCCKRSTLQALMAVYAKNVVNRQGTGVATQ